MKYSQQMVDENIEFGWHYALLFRIGRLESDRSSHTKNWSPHYKCVCKMLLSFIHSPIYDRWALIIIVEYCIWDLVLWTMLSMVNINSSFNHASIYCVYQSLFPPFYHNTATYLGLMLLIWSCFLCFAFALVTVFLFFSSFHVMVRPTIPSYPFHHHHHFQHQYFATKAHAKWMKRAKISNISCIVNHVMQEM